VPLSHLQKLAVRSFHLEVPATDFEFLPRRLGCSLQRSGRSLVLSTEQAGCSLSFEVDGPLALLTQVSVEDDVQGRFTQRVLGQLMIDYEGDLDADTSWVPERADLLLVVRAGESTHPLLARLRGAQEPRGGMVGDVDVGRLNQHLDEAALAWAEWQRKKAPQTPGAGA
jgi:hypothetical protein